MAGKGRGAAVERIKWCGGRAHFRVYRSTGRWHACPVSACVPRERRPAGLQPNSPPASTGATVALTDAQQRGSSLLAPRHWILALPRVLGQALQRGRRYNGGARGGKMPGTCCSSGLGSGLHGQIRDVRPHPPRSPVADTACVLMMHEGYTGPRASKKPRRQRPRREQC